MKIRTKILIGTLASIVMVVVLSVVIFFVNQEIDEAVEESQIADSILEKEFGLNIVIHEYEEDRGERAEAQWQSAYDTLTEILVLAKVDDPREKEIFLAQNLLREDRINKL